MKNMIREIGTDEASKSDSMSKRARSKEQRPKLLFASVRKVYCMSLVCAYVVFISASVADGIGTQSAEAGRTRPKWSTACAQYLPASPLMATFVSAKSKTGVPQRVEAKELLEAKREAAVVMAQKTALPWARTQAEDFAADSGHVCSRPATPIERKAQTWVECVARLRVVGLAGGTGVSAAHAIDVGEVVVAVGAGEAVGVARDFRAIGWEIS